MRITFTLLFFIFLATVSAQVDSTLTDSLTLQVNSYATLSGDELEEDSQGQDVSGLLYSGNDVFTSKAIFQFRAARFNVRGLNSDHSTVYLNGVAMNDPELGFPIWANWGGLNDITRRPETKVGITRNDYGFSGIGGFTNIDMKAATKRKGLRYSQALTNRSYRNRSMLTYNTGLMDNDIAISASISGRWAQEGYVEGTTYSAMGYFLSIDKKLNDQKSIGIIALGAPSVVGRGGLATEEAYQLKNNDFYNPYWGFQNGEKRNSRVRKNHKPIFMFWYENKINDQSKFTSNVYYQTGKYSQTRLTWNTGADPRGDYYRNLPSFYTDTTDVEQVAQYASLTEYWQNDVNAGQLDWDQFYFANGKNLHTVHDANGVEGETYQGMLSKYILEEDHSDPNFVGINMTFNHNVSDNISMDFGLNTNSYKSENYQIASDLLGGEYWVNVNPFAERDFGVGSDIAQNNIEIKNQIIREGDRFGYDYDMHINKTEIFAQVESIGEKLDLYGVLQGGASTFWRDGKVKNGLYPRDSKGESQKSSFNYGGVRGGAVYKISGRHFIEANANYSSRAPKVRNSFISPRTRNELAKNLVNEKMIATDISYIIRHPKMKARITWFNISVDDQTQILNVYLDEERSFGTLRLSNMDFLNTGIEIGVERKLSQTLSASAAFTAAQYLYDSRPLATFTVDNSGEVLFEDRLIYFKNYKQGRMPQTVLNIGLEYVSPKFWRLGMDFNQFTDMWLTPNPIRRSAESIDHLYSVDANYTEASGAILDQKKLVDGTTLNLNAGKSWKFDDKYLLLVLGINNLLNNTDFVSGFEQIRFDRNNINKFPPKLGHMYGTSYFLMVRMDF